MVTPRYIPDRGDVVWLNFSPQQGREQAHRRPAVVISPKLYNEKARLALLCPITSQIKGYPFEVPISERRVRGAILADQVRSLDWRARNASFIQRVKPATLSDVQEKLLTLIAA